MKVKMELDLMETGYLCNLIMARILDARGQDVPAWIRELYIKLTTANDDLMGNGEKK